MRICNRSWLCRAGLVCLLVLACLGPGLAADGGEDDSGQLPNIVVVLFDDVGYQDLHVELPDIGVVYLHEGVPEDHVIRTPNIDAFADGGMAFTRMAMNGTVCSPTRAALLTGVHPLRFGFSRALGSHSMRGLPDDPEIALLPRLLREEGYRTIHVGKWHLGYNKDKFLPVAKGYDIAVRLARELVGSERTVPWDGQDETITCFNGYSRYYQEVKKTYLNPCYDVLWTSENGFEKMEDAAPRRHSASVLTDWAMCLLVHDDPAEARRCVEELGEKGDEAIPDCSDVEQPFFLSLWYWSPHSPEEPPPTSAENDREGLGIPARDLLDNGGCVVQEDPKHPWHEIPDRWKYEELVCFLDHVVGRLLRCLDDTGNTIVIVTSDNGGTERHHAPEFGGNGFLSGYKGGNPDGLEEGSVRVPFLVRWPGHVPAAEVNETPLVTMDLLPTIAGIVGIDLSNYRIEGMSFLPALLADVVQTRPAPVGWEHMDHDAPLGEAGEIEEPAAAYRPKFSVLDGPWKLIGLRDMEGGEGPSTRLYRLYDSVPPEITTYYEEGDDRLVEDPARAADMVQWYTEWREEETTIPARVDLDASTGVVPCDGEFCTRYPTGSEMLVFAWDDRFDFSEGGFSFVAKVRPDPTALIGRDRMYVAGRAGSWELWLERDPEGGSWRFVTRVWVERLENKGLVPVATEELVVRSGVTLRDGESSREFAVQVGFENYKDHTFVATMDVREDGQHDRKHASAAMNGWRYRVVSGAGCETGDCTPVTLARRPGEGGEGFVGELENVRFHAVFLNDDEW